MTDFSRFDRMTEEELEAFLRQDIQNGSGNESEVLHVLELLELRRRSRGNRTAVRKSRQAFRRARRHLSDWIPVWRGSSEALYQDRKALLTQAGIPFEAKGINTRHPAGSGIVGSPMYTRHGWSQPGTVFVSELDKETWRYEIRIRLADYEKWRRLCSPDAAADAALPPVDTAPTEEVLELIRSRTMEESGPVVSAAFREAPEEETTVMPLKWHHWMTRFVLFLRSAVAFLLGILSLTGKTDLLIPSFMKAMDRASAYNHLSTDEVHHDILYGGILIFLGALLLADRFLLASFRKAALPLLWVSYAAACILAFLLPSLGAMLPLLSAAFFFCMFAVNFVYYKNRSSLFR